MSNAMQRATIRNIRRCVSSPRTTNTGCVSQLPCNHLCVTKPQHETSVHLRSYSSAAIDGNSNDNKSGGDASNRYVSPFQEIFDTIQEGKTFLGTTEFQYPNVKFLKCGVAEHHVRFKTTSYGRLVAEPFVQPNEHRVMLQVAIRHVPLTDIERRVLKEIVGNRLNENTGVLQLSSSQFGSRIENKRHVVSMLERAVESAKNLAARIVDEDAGKTPA